jgi:hypothetical protein
MNRLLKGIQLIPLVLLINLFLLNVAKGVEKTKQKFVISHINRDDIEPYIKLISGVYEELGFRVVLLPTPSTRGIKLVDEAVVDADVASTANDLEVNNANFIIVQPALNQAYLALLCLKNIPCSTNILQDNSVAFAITEPVFKLFTPAEFKANAVFVNTGSAITDILMLNRISYGLLIIDHALEKTYSSEFNIVKIKNFDVFHIIKKKHAGLLPQIEAKLREKLPAFVKSRE